MLQYTLTTPDLDIVTEMETRLTHPQAMLLVVPNGNYVRAGKDGFFRISNVPAGHHRVVAWAPDSKPAIAETDVSDAEAATVEIELKRGRGGPHLKKDGMPYGSYDK